MEKMTRDDGESKVDESSSKSNYVIRTKQNDPPILFHYRRRGQAKEKYCCTWPVVGCACRDSQTLVANANVCGHSRELVDLRDKMAPKKADADQTADQKQQQMGRISLLEQSMTKVETMEQTLSAMQQQMNAFFGRWEQEKNEQVGEKALSLEAAKGKAHQVGKTSIGEELSPVTAETGQALIQTPISAQGEGSERRG
ncbi:hypothetical protein F2Q68_00023740 [Brassica cretica]|uniref:Uncharacterized protein n=1 Tax=Brassica cretica TaxID=69181 RepID=A0A8S9I9S3_BRACR|nr:hypothetical protein F2Q68_00023740 [Brassica cretica]